MQRIVCFMRGLWQRHIYSRRYQQSEWKIQREHVQSIQQGRDYSEGTIRKWVGFVALYHMLVPPRLLSIWVRLNIAMPANVPVACKKLDGQFSPPCHASLLIFNDELFVSSTFPSNDLATNYTLRRAMKRKRKKKLEKSVSIRRYALFTIQRSDGGRKKWPHDSPPSSSSLYSWIPCIYTECLFYANRNAAGRGKVRVKCRAMLKGDVKSTDKKSLAQRRTQQRHEMHRPEVFCASRDVARRCTYQGTSDVKCIGKKCIAYHTCHVVSRGECGESAKPQGHFAWNPRDA